MKTALIMDNPKDCINCRLFGFGFCYGKRELVGEECITTSEKPEWCPLRPLPKRMTANLYYRKTSYICDWKERSCGWNECLDEILGDIE